LTKRFGDRREDHCWARVFKGYPSAWQSRLQAAEKLLPAEAEITDEVSAVGLRPPDILVVLLPLSAAQPFSQTQSHNQNQPGA
jgi:hypothetical protein